MNVLHAIIFYESMNATTCPLLVMEVLHMQCCTPIAFTPQQWQHLLAATSHTMTNTYATFYTQ